MEISLHDAKGIPDSCIISIRAGATRRQAPLETVRTHPLKFPSPTESCCEPLKIDVLQPIATARLVLHPNKDGYCMVLDSQDESFMQLGLGIHNTNSTDKEPANTLATTKYQDAATSAREYLEFHGLLRYVQSLLHAVIQVRPKDPYDFMMKQLGSAVSISAEKEACPVSDPQEVADLAGAIASAVGPAMFPPLPTENLPSAPLPPNEAPPSLQNHERKGAGPEVGTGDVEKLKSSEDTWVADLSCADAPPPVPVPKPTNLVDAVDGVSKCVPCQDDDLPPPPTNAKPEEAEKEMSCPNKSVPLQSKSSDDDPPPPSPEVPGAADLPEPKCVAVENDLDQPPVASNLDDPHLEELKERMRSMLEKAAGSGQLEAALAALVPPEGGSGTGTCTKSQDALGLSESELRGRMGEMLQKAAASGELSVALAGLTDQPCDTAPPDSNHDADLKCQLASVLQRAAASGQLEVALADIVRAQEQADSVVSVVEIKQLPHEADGDINVNELRDRLCGVLERASESGHLERALSMARGLEEGSQTAGKPPEKPDAMVDTSLQDALESNECKSRPPPDYVEEDEPRRDSKSTSVLLENVNEVKKMYENLSRDTQELHQTVEGMASTLSQLRKENQELRDKMGPSATGSTDR